MPCHVFSSKYCGSQSKSVCHVLAKVTLQSSGWATGGTSPLVPVEAHLLSKGLAPRTCSGTARCCLGDLLCTKTDRPGTSPGCATFTASVFILLMRKILACFSLTFLACAPNFWITNPMEHLKEESRIQEACLFFSCVVCFGCLSELSDWLRKDVLLCHVLWELPSPWKPMRGVKVNCKLHCSGALQLHTWAIFLSS